MKPAATPRSPTPSRPPPPPRTKAKPKQASPLQGWFAHHLHVLLWTLGQLSRTPVASLLTAAVIGIALALPTALYLLLDNVQAMSRDWQSTVQISLFLQPDINDAHARALGDELYARPDIRSVRFISKAEALAEYQQLSGFAEAVEMLPDNPLPAVLVIQPAASVVEPDLLATLRSLPEVELAQSDMRWLERLLVMMTLLERGVLIIGGLLGLTVLLVVGNTIRLTIENQRDEIEIYKLFGATDAFIRRPFLYRGFWFGLVGGVIAWLVVMSVFALLQVPVQNLALLYYSDFSLHGLGIVESFLLFMVGIGLGLGGAWLAVAQHLQAIQPH